MATSSRKFAAAILLAAMQARVVPAQDDAKSEPTPSKPSRAELRERQIDVSLEARDIERILGKLSKASELSKTRITEAAKSAEAATSALERGESTVARTDALQAAEMFEEIARLLAALLEEETPQRVAAARDMANALANSERQLADELQRPIGQGGQPAKEPSTKKGAAGDANSALNPQKGAGNENQGDPADKDGNGPTEKTKSAAKEKDTEVAAEPDRQKGTTVPGKQKDPAGTGGTGEQPDPVKEKPKDQPGTGGDKQDPAEEGKGGAAKTKKDLPGKIGTADEPKVERNSGAGDKSEKDPKVGKSLGPGGGNARRAMTDDERREALAARAEQLARNGQTLQDILKRISESSEIGRAHV